MSTGDYFEPVIGSSFDSLAGQRFGWAGLNNQTQTGNISRAIAAQQEANNYFQQVAAQRQAAINRQAEMDWAGQQASVTQQQADAERAVRAHQFDVNTQLTQEDIARREGDTQKQIDKQDEATHEKAREFDLGTEQQKQLAADNVNNTGQALATTYAASKRQLDQADKVVNDFQGEHDELTKEVAELGQNADKTPEDVKKLSADNARLSLLKKALPKAIQVQDRLQQRHLALSDNLQSRGYVTDEESGKLTHLETGKTWSFDNALKKAKEAISGQGETSTGTNDYFDSGTGAASGTQTTTGVLPLPKSKSDLQAGKAYKVGAKLMTWNGEKFIGAE